MSKIREMLTEKTHPFLEAWEDTYLDTKRLKDMLGLMMDGQDEDEVKELMDIVVGLEKYYVKNTKKVMKITKKLED